MRTLCAAVLTFESIIVLLSIPVAIVVYGLAAPRRGDWRRRAHDRLPACCRKSEANVGPDRRVGATGPHHRHRIYRAMMFFLGVVFAIMWFYAIRVGRQGDAIKAARQAQESAT